MTLQKTKRDVYTCTVERYAVRKKTGKTSFPGPTHLLFADKNFKAGQDPGNKASITVSFSTGQIRSHTCTS